MMGLSLKLNVKESRNKTSIEAVRCLLAKIDVNNQLNTRVHMQF